MVREVNDEEAIDPWSDGAVTIGVSVALLVAATLWAARRYGWAITTAIAGACLLAASEVPNFMAGALPSFMTIGRFAASDEDVDRLRDGERWARVPIVAVGVGSVAIFKSPWPGVFVAGTLAWYWWGYERHIQNPSDGAVPINAQAG